MKRFLFGLLLSFIGHNFSLFCFIWAVKEPWFYHGIEGVLGSLLAKDLLAPFCGFFLLMLVGISVCCAEAFRRSPKNNR